MTLYLGKAEVGEKLEAAVKALGYRSISHWASEQARRAIAEAEGSRGQGHPRPSGRDREALLAELVSVRERAQRLRAKLGGELPALRKLYAQLGGDEKELSNLDEALPRVYAHYRGPLEKAVVFEQYARLSRRVFELRRQLGI